MTWDENMANQLILIGLIIGLFTQNSWGYRSPAEEGHSEFFEKCYQGLQFHPQMLVADSKVKSSSFNLCRCAQKEFENDLGEMQWPNFDRFVFLKSIDKCLLPLSITGPTEYQLNGSALFDLWVERDLENKLIAREPAGINHFVSLESMISERQCVKEGMIKECFDGTLSQSYKCLLNKVSDPEVMNFWQIKCREPNIELPML